MGFFESDSILFKILNEADDDDILNGSMDDNSGNKDYGANDNNDNAAADNNNDQNNDNADDNNNDDGGDDEDFSIDVGDIGDDDEGSNDAGNDDTSDGNLDTGGSSGATEGEVNQANTDIFDTLTAEEQSIKISELKKQFNELYVTINETITKLKTVDNDNIDFTIVYRLSSTLYDLRGDVSTYIFKIFPTKSYFENDVAYNRFLSILNGISSVLGEISTKILGKSK